MSRPRIRTLKPEVWRDEALGEISRDARLLFVGLVTQADDEGRLSGNARLIRSSIFPFDDLSPNTLEEWLRELADCGLIRRYEAGGRPYLALSGWHNQKVDKPTPSKIPPPPDLSESPSPSAITTSRDDSANAREESQNARASRARDGSDRIGSDQDPESGLCSPHGRAGALRAISTSAGGDEREALAEQVRGILQRGIDGLTTTEPCRAPGRGAVLEALRRHPVSEDVAIACAVDARSVAQSQNRAPNIVALFERRLSEHREEAA